MSDFLEFIKSIKGFPVVDKVIFHCDHVQIVKARLIVQLRDLVLAKGQSSYSWKNSKANDFIPRFNTILFEIDKSEILKVLFR